ncbi:MAG: NAD-dependent deacylase [Desulfobacterales bacterium]|nr:NAD-dependent deacylase [Desulfobacterales bacterium]
MQELIKSTAEALMRAKHCVALTGAGISVESGIPPFRGKGGIWEKYDPMEYAHIDAFMSNPTKVWQVLLKDMKSIVDKARPNDAHLGLARLEQLGILKTIITQNVDGLHQLAGNTDVIEFHGNFAWHRCLDCRQRIATHAIDLTTIPPHCQCGGIYRPECIFFGEAIPPQHLMRSQQEATRCDVMLVIGTSAVVQPVALMPVIARETNAKVFEINPERTPLTDNISNGILEGKAGHVMNRLVEEVERQLSTLDPIY